MPLPSRPASVKVVNGSLQLPPGFPRVPEVVKKRFPEMSQYELDVATWWKSTFQTLSDSNGEVAISISQNFDRIAEIGRALGTVLSNGENGPILNASEFQIAGVKVLETPSAPIADATGLGDVVAQLNALLAAARTQGFLET